MDVDALQGEDSMRSACTTIRGSRSEGDGEGAGIPPGVIGTDLKFFLSAVPAWYLTSGIVRN